MKPLKKPMITTMSGLLLALGFASAAKAEHSTLFTCYAYVHDQCYGDNSANCSQDDYEWGLNECDGYYPQSKPIRKPALGLATPAKKNVMRTRSIIGQSFR